MTVGRCTLCVFILAIVAIVAPCRADVVNVFAAASLSDALKEIAQRYEPASGDTLRFNLGASSALARQIKEGAPADIFFSADEAKMDDLVAAGLIDVDSRRTALSNTLAIIVNIEGAHAIESPAGLASQGVRRIALAETETVPAGIYAREYLEKTGLWERVAAKVVGTENVRAALAAVESGNADAGIVYKTDALISRKVKVAFEVSLEEGPKIAYPLAVVKKAGSAAAARRFVDYLASPEATAVFARHGFLPVR